ncbi:DUF2637 domain-containing protein [Streptomyces iranensis]|uniref:DUF2637 domain-containing protein n=1 Tax=Streptomyces iranensis TaxID=576784 RepID=UPI0039B7446D
MVVSPVALSSQDLFRWAESPTGLGLSGLWPYLVSIALDAAAVLCISLTMHAAWKGQAGGAARLLVWVFAGMSAFANWRHSAPLLARDAVWFFPAMSVLGAILLEVAISRIRRVNRAAAGVYESPLPRFRFLRWVIARDETWQAFKSAVVENISSPQEAVSVARAKSSSPFALSPGEPDLSGIPKRDAIRHAFAAMRSYDAQGAVDWLARRGVRVSRSYAHVVAREEQRANS